MGTSVRDRGIAVVGSGIKALLHEYFLQRFGFEADVFLDDLDFPQFTSDELVSSWLGLYQSPDAARIAWQDIAEFRDIALDLGAAVISSPLGSTIFERRPDHVDALEEFADNRRANGLLVRFSTQVAHLDVPPSPWRLPDSIRIFRSHPNGWPHSSSKASSVEAEGCSVGDHSPTCARRGGIMRLRSTVSFSATRQ